jgi:hypothetical protein
VPLGGKVTPIERQHPLLFPSGVLHLSPGSLQNCCIFPPPFAKKGLQCPDILTMASPEKGAINGMIFPEFFNRI